jgi:hypothetical protein
MKRGSEAFRWEARGANSDVTPLQDALGAWVHAGVGRSEFRWEAREARPDVTPLQAALGAWVRAGVGR